MLPVLIDMIVWGGTYDDQTEAEKDFLIKATNNREGLITSIQAQLEKDHLSN